MDDNTRQVVRNEETVVAGQPEQTTVTQTESSTADTMVNPAPVAATPAYDQATVQTTTASTTPSDQMVAHNVAERVVDPAAEKAAAVGWVNRLIWFIVGLMVILLAIRLVLLGLGANESTGFAQLTYGLTGWMVAPFKGLFGSNWTYPGTAGTAIFEPEAIVAILVYILIGWGLTKLAELMLGTNRTTGTVYSETERRTKM
jgi:multisubunit Na+/H+ antiporter MnhC subunit